MSALGGQIAPIGGNRTNYDPIAGFESANLGADLVHHADRFMPQGKILARPNRATDRMRIRGADKRHRGLDYRVQWARPRHRLVSKPDLADRLHYKGFHKHDLRAAESRRFVASRRIRRK